MRIFKKDMPESVADQIERRFASAEYRAVYDTDGTLLEIRTDNPALINFAISQGLNEI